MFHFLFKMNFAYILLRILTSTMKRLWKTENEMLLASTKRGFVTKENCLENKVYACLG